MDNTYLRNARIGATPNPVMLNPDAADRAFADAADDVLKVYTEMLRQLIPSHQSAIAIIVDGDWSSIRKYFSLSAKYEKWSDYAESARGQGVHEWLRHQHGVVRMTQHELVNHPQFTAFAGDQAHPPMRGWLATTIRDREDTVWGIVQLSDRADSGEYTQSDEASLTLFTQALQLSLGGLWDLRNERKSHAKP